MSNRQDESHIEPYRSLSAKRLRDPSHRKSVSFNDVPIVHEVPSYDTMRSSNSDIYRTWTYADATLPFSSSHILLPFNSTSAAAQKLHAQRLSSTLYSSTTNNTTLNRLNDWPIRTKTIKTFEETTEHNINSNPPLIIVHTPDQQINKISSENNEEKKNLYRSPIIPDNEHYRSLPFSYLPLSESTTTYTSMLTTNLINSNNQIPNGHTRTIRTRSATLPITETHSSIRNNDNILIPSLRTTPNILSSRTVLKPTTIAVHSSTNTPTLISKPPVIPPRSSSFSVHSRLNRPSSSINKHVTSSTTLTRSRSANILLSKRHTTSSVVMPDGQSGGTKRNSNIKQTYGSYYMHPVLLPANIN